MTSITSMCKAIGLGAIVAALSVGIAVASESPASTAAAQSERSIIVAQAGTTSRAGGPVAAFPSAQAGVRAAAAQGPEALRRYVNRTRMIYNYYYWEFAAQ